MKKWLLILLAPLVAYAGTNTIPVVTSNIVRKTHVNQYQTGITGDWVPRNTSGVATDDAGALGQSTLRWGDSYIDTVTLGVATNNVRVDEASGEFELYLNNLLFLTTDDAQDELTVGPTAATEPTIGFSAGDAVIHSPGSLSINADSNNDSTDRIIVFGMDTDNGAGATDRIFLFRENGTGTFVDGSGNATINFNQGLGVDGTDDDVNFTGNGVVTSDQSMIFHIDADNDSTNRTFGFRHNASTSVGGQQLMILAETTAGDGASLVLGEATASGDELFKACLSSDCSATFVLDQETATSVGALVYSKDSNSNGFIVANEDAALANPLHDILQLSYSGDTNVTGADYVEFTDSDTVNGRIRAASDQTVAYDTSSDARLKENPRPIPNALQTVLDMPIYEFDWKDSGHTDHGTFAQEMKDVYPLAVGGLPDGDPKLQPMSVDYSKLVPVLVAAVQELHRDNETLKRELVALKGSALTDEFIRDTPTQVNDYERPQYNEDVAKRIGCADFSQCKDLYRANVDAHCTAPHKLHLTEQSVGNYRLECRELTGYATKNIQKWKRRSP